jgi:hypothetical protein
MTGPAGMQSRLAPSPTWVAIPSVALQRKCSCGRDTIGPGENKSDMILQRRSINAPETGITPPIVQEVVRSPGQPLEASTRAFMEPRFGSDFSQVRVHTDAKAAESARAVGALAYTLGTDIVFGTGQYPPRTSNGLKLLAHELTHTIQQRTSKALNTTIELGSLHEAAEHNADEAADAVASGQSVRLTPSFVGGVATTGVVAGQQQSPRLQHTIQVHSVDAPAVQRKMILSNTDAESAKKFFVAHRFDEMIFQIRPRGRDLLVQTALHERPSRIEREILWALAHSHFEHPETLDHLNRELDAFSLVVSSARQLAGDQLSARQVLAGRRRGERSKFGKFGQYRPSGEEADGEVKLNKKFWELTKTPDGRGGFDVTMRTLADVKPSDAIRDIFENPELYAYECYSSTAFIQLHSLLSRVGDRQFDAIETGHVTLKFTATVGPAEIIRGLEEFGLKEVDLEAENKFDELIPGDHATFKGKSGFEENVIYVGGGEFFAHPLEIIKDKGEIEDYFKTEDLFLDRFVRRWSV